MSDPKMVFAKNLERARKRLGISQDRLAKDVGLTRQAIYKYEKGDVNPSMDAVFRLASQLKVDVEYFFQYRSEREDFNRWLEIIDFTPCEALTQVNYREQQKLTPESTEKVKNDTYKELIKLLAIEEITNDKIDFRNPIDNIPVRNREDAEKAALEVRKKWQLYDNPVTNVINLLESKGIRVFEVNADENFQGLSARYGNLPIIVLNFKMQEVTRKRFTALHELGHLILQITEGIDHETIEKICDAFAATMLLPKQLLILELGGRRHSLGPVEILRLKAMYGISVQAILVGAFSARIIEYAEYLRLTNTVSNRSVAYRMLEHPTRFRQLLTKALAEGMVDARKVTSLKSGAILDDIPHNLITAAL
ncbi:helix-turn-helix domain-containing protein [Chryseolinea soli]|nr:XRE family transcriptional regulator [Chryseolinea soli]